MKSNYDVTIMKTRTCRNVANLLKVIAKFLRTLPEYQKKKELYTKIIHAIEEFILMQNKVSAERKYGVTDASKNN